MRGVVAIAAIAVLLMPVMAGRAALNCSDNFCISTEEMAQELATYVPEVVLERSYARYIISKKCFAARQDYFSIYISDSEMERAKTAVAGIEKIMTANHPELDTDTVWAHANQRANGGIAEHGGRLFRQVCQA